MNQYSAAFDAVASAVRLPVERWGGDATTRYNWQLDVYNSASDWYFSTDPNSNTGYPDSSEFNSTVLRDRDAGVKTMGTVPMIGWTTKRQRGCGYSVAKYGAQKEVNPYNSDCGKGVRLDGSQIENNDPNDTSIPIGPQFAKDWIKYLVRRFGDIDLAEEAVQDAFIVAVQRWPSDGLPPSPAGWIITTARNRAIDRFRREASREYRHAQAALLYRAASRDWMPIHADPAVAREAGFERPISHGLNNLGLACRAILKACAPGRPERLRALAARFVAPGLPGDTVRIELFDRDGATLAFRATAVERGVRLLDRGSCELHG